MSAHVYRAFDFTNINAHLHCGKPRPRGVLPAEIKAPHVVTNHPTSRAKMHRPAWAIIYNLDGRAILGAKFLCGSASSDVSAVVDPGGADRCHRCEDVAGNREWVVYCYYDAADAPLYVGESRRLNARHVAHRNSSAWFADVANLSILSTHSTRREALVAEAHAIADLKPAHNRRQNLHLLRPKASA